MKPEAILQQQACAALSSRGLLFFSIPNERWGSNLKILGLLKKMGLAPGAPDLAILSRGKAYFVEFKRPDGKGRVKENQSYVHDRIRLEGFEIAVVESMNEFEDFLRENNL